LIEEVMGEEGGSESIENNEIDNRIEDNNQNSNYDNFDKINIEKLFEFNIGEPFTPFQQLIAVLPRERYSS
jgi:hypothetical protein